MTEEERLEGNDGLPLVELAPGYRIPRLIVGGWQLSAGHRVGGPDPDEVVEALVALADRGFTAFDCADIYTGVEELFGRFLARWRTTSMAGEARSRGRSGGERRGGGEAIRIHTKLVPDWSDLPQVGERYVRRIVERSLRRLGVEALDLVQFYWWDQNRGDWLRAARALGRLQEEGKILHVGATNLTGGEVETLEREAGLRVLSNQVQYSVLDRRPELGLTEVSRRTGLHLLAYGALAGGFLTSTWAKGRRGGPGAGAQGTEAPRKPPSPGDLPNRSLVKYRLIIEEFGGWEAYQDLLRELSAIGEAHGVGPAQVALRFVLDQPGVAAAIVGFSSPARMEENRRALQLRLTPADHAAIRRHTGPAPGPAGDIFALERNRTGPHGRIMRYDQNQA
jgi:aryl-alcohol dehydrogenase-like predicted oxidoreductase